MKGSTIIRAQHGKETPYFSTARSTAKDKTLSYEARGMLWYLLAQPDDWEVQVNDLKISGKAGRDKVYTILKELKAAGHLSREKIRRDDGTWEWSAYRVYEIPCPENPDTAPPLPENPDVVTGEPFPENPDTVKPDTVKPEIKEHNTESTENRITEKDSASSDASTASQPMYDAPIELELPPKPVDPEKAVNIAIGEIIKAYLETQQIIDKKAYSKKGFRDAARELHEAGITPEEVTGFVRERKTDAFWADKTLTWKHIKDNIQGWKSRQSAQPDNPAHRIFIPEEKEQCRGGRESGRALLETITEIFTPEPLPEPMEGTG